MRNKVLLAAIAKDEAAYLPAWIFYHISKGFDGIEIYVNNTSDNSYEILERIAKEESKLSYKNADYILEDDYQFNESILNLGFKKRAKIQACSYNEIIQNSMGKYTHVMFLDIDEFFITTNGNSIHDLLNKYNQDLIALNWFNQTGCNEEFGPVIPSVLLGGFKPTIKTITKLPESLSEIKILNSHTTHIENGRSFNFNSHLKDHSESQFFILHKSLRSEAEYLALILRGDTYSNASNGFKLNRSGWNNNYKQRIALDNSYCKNINSSFTQFLLDCKIKNMLDEAQLSILNKSKLVKEKAKQLETLYSDVAKVLAGTHLGLNRDLRPFSELLSQSSTLMSHFNPNKAKTLNNLSIKVDPNNALIKKNFIQMEKITSTLLDKKAKNTKKIAKSLDLIDTQKANELLNLLCVLDQENIRNKLEFEKKSQEKPKSSAIIFRDCAIKLEKIDIQKSFELMTIAKILSPKGKLISSKLEEYDKLRVQDLSFKNKLIQRLIRYLMKLM